ncbi:O-antigen polysaccharide polymerase Wzy [Staphylococcus haemolyticus]|uniref:O-antigen polysaccharide polymerase Wzy n=2 Tax=Staphylococcus haemolyticus TaxID=1283 RepID=UPI0004A8A843|nr:O-antigen polysaccharide polymerase Wzy [Staphylococcus haemolyticus]KDP49007.1 oligosaccharide repeat unit polymerase [Staphylococcus aureus subsp. aureus CO-98]MBK3954939.1 O-antigen polysaccharide polymerase Wzy [Staphylococcus haemolyticus]MBV5129888.1 O-antigen polysaccharide polymerase Wzy [Staphylococcus haemolyticus]MBV6665739.1 O-antigen polysaccharide polymerase Wzy [Staphylococcus haemolyticus]MBW4893461.1 O-antigen polysaccharide polymerase Wzy [Staphylococcus haemolyticus]
MVIFIFLFITLIYGLFLFWAKFRFISLFFVSAFSISFLLPIIINKPFNYKIFVDQASYMYVNKLYLLALVIFVITNFLTQISKLEFKLDNYTRLNTNNLNKIYPFYILGTIFVILLTGLNIISKGSTSTLDSSSIVKMLQGSVLMGYLYLSYLYLYNAHSKKEKLKSIVLILISLILVSIFIFGRRILLYPTIAIVVLYIYKRGKTPSLTKLASIGLVIILIILPLMMSIRTFGLKAGFTNFKDILFGDYNKYLDYLALGTDVTYSYSLATIVTNYHTHISLLTLLKPIFIFIPRSLWPDKPGALSEELVKQLNLPFDKGMSIPPGFVGESYVYLGIIGIILASSIFGILCGLADQYSLKLRKSKEGIYSIKLIFITIISIQIIMGSIRGDTATNIQEAFYLFIPLGIMLWLSKFKIKFK